MEILSEIKRFIYKDVKGENETKRVAVVQRLNSVIMCFYFLSLISYSLLIKETFALYFCLPCLGLYAFSFYLTYQNRTKIALLFMHGMTYVWILSFIYFLGWSCGVQQFLFVLLVIYYISSVASDTGKLLYTIFLCVTRLLLYVYCLDNEPICELSDSAYMFFQTINTITIISCVVVVLTAFSKDNQEMEKKLRSYNEKLHQLAFADSLTGLINRRGMQERLEGILQSSNLKDHECITLAMGDIDFFKRVNDQYGHVCGDYVLQKLAELLEHYMEDKGYVSRWGGEEFLLVFINKNGDDTRSYLYQLLEKINKTNFCYEDQSIMIAMTFGVAEYDESTGFAKTIADADEKLYIGKKSGRNKIVF